MVLCFAVLVKILLLCSNQGTTQKVICARLLSSINSKYGYELEADESTISKLMTCKVGLSPEEIVNVIPVANFEGVKHNILAEIVPLLNRNTLPCGLVALKYIIDQDENIDSNSVIGFKTVDEITQLTNVDIADCITNLLYYTVLGIHNTKGASTIKLVTKEYVNGFQSQAGAVSFIRNSRSVPAELSKTLVNSNFNDVFTKVRSKAALELSNRSGIEMYYLDIAESCFDYCELSDYLLSCVGRYTVGSVLSQLNNYLGLSHAAPDYFEPSILERITNEYEKSLLQIPFEQDKYFLRSQKYVYDHMNEEVFFSYSSSTSMGKSFVMRTFIRDKIKKNDNCNFAVIVPTRALINEIFRALAEDMSCILREHDYRIVTSSGNSIVKDKNKHRYIFVMTPERMMYQLLEYPDIPVHYVFIDEAQNISKKDGRSAYYYQIVNMLMQSKTQPHIIFASPHIPNPEVYLGVAVANVEAKSLSSVFTPVSQEKFLIDMNSGTYGYYNPLSAQLKTVGKFPEMSLSMVVNQFGAGKRNLVYCNFKSAVVSSAVRYSKLLKPVNDAELIEFSQEIREQIHPDYYLAYTVERGLLEGVNMPADNLFITDYRNGYSPLSDVEFRNLTGRVGRLQYSLYGNVFLICMKDEEISPQSYVELLKSGIKKQTLSVSDLSYEVKQYIVKSLALGTTKLTQLAEQSDSEFALMRKTAGILLRDIMSGR